MLSQYLQLCILFREFFSDFKYFLCTLNIAGPHALTIGFFCVFKIYLFGDSLTNQRPQAVMATAQVLFHRFYCKKSFVRFSAKVNIFVLSHSDWTIFSLFWVELTDLFAYARRELLLAVFGWQGSWRRVLGNRSILYLYSTEWNAGEKTCQLNT